MLWDKIVCVTQAEHLYFIFEKSSGLALTGGWRPVGVGGKPGEQPRPVVAGCWPAERAMTERQTEKTSNLVLVGAARPQPGAARCRRHAVTAHQRHLTGSRKHTDCSSVHWVPHTQHVQLYTTFTTRGLPTRNRVIISMTVWPSSALRCSQ